MNQFSMKDLPRRKDLNDEGARSGRPSGMLMQGSFKHTFGSSRGSNTFGDICHDRIGTVGRLLWQDTVLYQ